MPAKTVHRRSTSSCSSRRSSSCHSAASSSTEPCTSMYQQGRRSARAGRRPSSRCAPPAASGRMPIASSNTSRPRSSAPADGVPSRSSGLHRQPCDSFRCGPAPCRPGVAHSLHHRPPGSAGPGYGPPTAVGTEVPEVALGVPDREGREGPWSVSIGSMTTSAAGGLRAARAARGSPSTAMSIQPRPTYGPALSAELGSDPSMSSPSPSMSFGMGDVATALAVPDACRPRAPERPPTAKSIAARASQ